MIKFLYLLIRYSGLFFLFRKTVLKRKVTIVTYHNPKPDIFEKHIKFLQKYYQFISLNKLTNCIKNNNWSDIPNNSIVVTIDDGHQGNSKLINTIKEYNFKPTIYCCSDIVNTKRHFWWKEVKQGNIEYLKKKKNIERLDELKKLYNFFNDKEYESRQTINKSEIHELSDFVDFGSHTRFHPILTCCSNNEKRDEIITSKKNIENITKRECNNFCYPNGDYDNKTIELVELAGYQSARSLDVGWNGKNANLYKLKTTWIADDASINLLVTQLLGITMFFKYLGNGSLRGLKRTIIPLKNR